MDKKSPIPVLTCALVKSTTLIGTTLDDFTIVPFEGKGKGEFLVPHKKALDVLMGEKGPLTIECLETGSEKDKNLARKVKFTVGAVELEFDTQSQANFPQIPEPGKTTLALDGETVKTLTDRTRFAVSAEASRYTLQATLVKVVNGKTVMVATDGHRLSYVTGPSEGKLKDTLIRPATMDWVRKNCSDKIAVGADENFITICTGNGTIIAKKQSGQFPNYEAVMPTKNGIALGFASADHFSNILKRIAKCADERSRAIRLKVTDDSVTISASSLENGSAKADVQCSISGLNGHPVEIGFCADYILDFLNVVKKGEFKIALKDSQSAGLFEVDNFKHVVMPMRI